MTALTKAKIPHMPEVPIADYERRNVPMPLRRAVKVLNEAVALDAKTLTTLFDLSLVLGEKEGEAFKNHEDIIVRENDKIISLSALGVLAGIVNESKYYGQGFRLAMEVGTPGQDDDEDNYIHRFYVIGEEEKK